MGLFGVLVPFLKSPVGNNLANDLDDVRAVKHRLTRLGLFNEVDENGYITHELDRAIRTFQRSNDLKEDGILHPGGETERAIIRTLQKTPVFSSSRGRYQTAYQHKDTPSGHFTTLPQKEEHNSSSFGPRPLPMPDDKNGGSRNGALPNSSIQKLKPDEINAITDLIQDVRKQGNNRRDSGLIFARKISDHHDNNPDDVKQLQKIFGRLGFLDKDKHVDSTGLLDTETRDAILTFQKSIGLQENGIVEPDGETHRSLETMEILRSLAEPETKHQTQQKRKEQSARHSQLLKRVLRVFENDSSANFEKRAALEALMQGIAPPPAASHEGRTADPSNPDPSAKTQGSLMDSGLVSYLMTFKNAKDALERKGHFLEKMNAVLPAAQAALPIAQAAIGAGVGFIKAAGDTALDIAGGIGDSIGDFFSAGPAPGPSTGLSAGNASARMETPNPLNADRPAGGDSISGKTQLNMSQKSEIYGPFLPQDKASHTIDTFLPRIRGDEGGYVKTDPAGPTNIGINAGTLEEYEAFKKAKGEELPSIFTKDITKVRPELARQIYDEMYYKRYNIDKIADPRTAGQLLDIAINPGPVKGGKWLQEELNRHLGTNLKIDGVVGPSTRAAVERAGSLGLLDEINNGIALKRLSYYQKLAQSPDYSAYLKGWSARARSYLMSPKN